MWFDGVIRCGGGSLQAWTDVSRGQHRHAYWSGVEQRGWQTQCVSHRRSAHSEHVRAEREQPSALLPAVQFGRCDSVLGKLLLTHARTPGTRLRWGTLFAWVVAIRTVFSPHFKGRSQVFLLR